MQFYTEVILYKIYVYLDEPQCKVKGSRAIGGVISISCQTRFSAHSGALVPYLTLYINGSQQRETDPTEAGYLKLEMNITLKSSIFVESTVNFFGNQRSWKKFIPVKGMCHIYLNI